MVKTIGVMSGKGGVGKTVVSINLAAGINKWYDKKVLLVDCNITTSHIGLYLGIYATPVTLNDVLKSGISPERAVYSHECGIDVMPASLTLGDLKGVPWESMKDVLSNTFQNYDYVLLDSAPGFGKESLIALTASQDAILVGTPLIPSVADLIKCKRICDGMGVVPIGAIFNKVRGKKYELTKDEIARNIDIKVINSIPYDERVIESIVSKQPVINMRSRVNIEFRKLAALVDGQPPPRVSFASKIRQMLARG